MSRGTEQNELTLKLVSADLWDVPTDLSDETALPDDPLADLMGEFRDIEDGLEEVDELAALPPLPLAPKLTSEMSQERSIYVLQQQLEALSDGLQRLNFYLEDISDAIRR